MTIVFAEMPEAAGRDLSIERQHLPAAARIENFTYAGNQEALVAGAALDVLAQDSPDLLHHPLAGRDDVLLTPHVAFYSESALADLRRISAQNVRAFLEGRPDQVFRLVSPTEGAT